MTPRQRRSHGISLVSLALLAGALAACVGEIGAGHEDGGGPGGSGGPPPGGPLSCEVIEPGATPLRRLTRLQYQNTVRSLFGESVLPSESFPGFEPKSGFGNDIQLNTIDLTGTEKVMDAAAEVSAQVVPALSEVLACDAQSDGDAACLAALLDDLVPRAYRRPLLAEERDRLATAFDVARADGTFADAAGVVLEVVLQSPQFLYMHETGDAPSAEGGVMRMTDWELASRLSYLFWNTMPDGVLFDAAAAGELHTPEQVAAQARRLLDDERARPVVALFASEWMGMGRLAHATKDPDLFPDFADGVAAAMDEEIGRLLGHFVFDTEGTLDELLTTPVGFVNGPLAAVYGVAGPASADAWQQVELDPSQRAGLLTRAGIMAAQAHAGQTSPVLRGKLVREQLLCGALAPPPANVDVVLPDVDPSVPLSEQLEQHRTDPVCGSCHVLMDPIGLAFQHYDPAGAWRDQEGEVAIDATGEIVSSKSSDGVFEGAVELGAHLAESDEVARCVATQWFRYSAGRDSAAADQCNIDHLEASFAASDLSLRELLVSIATSDGFLYRRLPEDK